MIQVKLMNVIISLTSLSTIVIRLIVIYLGVFRFINMEFAIVFIT